MKKIFGYIVSFVFAVGAVSCEDDELPVVLSIASDDARVEVADDGSSASLTVGPDGGSVHFRVLTSSAWSVAETSGATWCHVEQANDKFVLLVDQFLSDKPERMAFFSVTNMQGLEASVTLKQTAEKPVTVQLVGDVHVLSCRGGETDLAVQSEAAQIEVEIVDATVDWLSADWNAETRTIHLSAARNFTRENLSARVVVTAGEGTNRAEAEWPIMQHNGALTFDYTVAAEGTVIALPLWGAIDCMIDWDEGSATESFRQDVASADDQITHWYEKPGTYRISVFGHIEGICTANAERVMNHLTALVQWGDVGLTSLNGALAGTAIESLPEADDYALVGVTDAASAFDGCAMLEEVPVGLFDAAVAITDFSALFRGCAALRGDSPYTLVGGEAVHLYERTAYSDRFAEPTAHAEAFAGCEGLNDFAAIPADWK